MPCFHYLTDFLKSFITYLVNAGFLSSSSVVTVKPGSLATWFRPEPQYTRTRGMRKLVGVHRHKSSFLLRPCFFLWAWTEGCHGDEVGLSPTAWSGKSSSLLWHLLRLEETETIERNTQTHTHTEHQESGWRVSNCQLQKVNGLNDNTCNIRRLTHTWRIGCHCLYLNLFIFFSVSIHPPSSIPGLLFICSHLDLASKSVSQHIFPSWSFSQPNSRTQPMHRHECKQTDREIHKQTHI